MIASAVYGFVAAILVLVITFMVIILTSRFEKAGYGIMYGSLFIKMVTLSCLLYTSPNPRDVEESRMPSSA